MNSTQFSPEVMRIKLQDKAILKNIYQLYLHDLSSYNQEDLDHNGLYDVGFLDLFWEKEGLFPFFINIKDNVIGFILVQTGRFAPSTGEDYYISEFFILRKYRRKGIGKAAISKLFSLFPGTYLLGQMPTNMPAIQFWKSLFKSLDIEFQEFIKEDMGPLLYQRFEV